MFIFAYHGSLLIWIVAPGFEVQLFFFWIYTLGNCISDLHLASILSAGDLHIMPVLCMLCFYQTKLWFGCNFQYFQYKIQAFCPVWLESLVFKCSKLRNKSLYDCLSSLQCTLSLGNWNSLSRSSRNLGAI